MSTEAVKWAMDDAPMLRTEKGKPDTTARHVLQALAEHAHKDGSGAHPSLLKLQYRTGYDRRTVQRAERRLEAAGLISADGSVHGCIRWRLHLNVQRPASDWAELVAEEEAERAAAAERQRRSRAKRVTHSDDVTVTDAECVTKPDVTHSEYARHVSEARDVTHSASGRHALNATRTINEPPQEPPGTDGAEVGDHSDPPWAALPLAPIDHDGFTLTDGMRRWALSTFGPGLDLEYETAQFLDHFRANGQHRTNWPAEWQKWVRRSAKYASQGRSRRPAAEDGVVPFPSGRRSTTDDRVAQALAIAAELRALEEGNPA
ncbi:helix-turn-helix domain-containing protein [Streptomyces sp. NPDC001404]|uniref:helix-turn-helix domain-containing protein n=1 Tax=Streptomyces sp. NPDC001404 TaxID=3364571 RepID=UPI0036BCD506